MILCSAGTENACELRARVRRVRPKNKIHLEAEKEGDLYLVAALRGARVDGLHGKVLPLAREPHLAR